jgi:hypothetical protein
MSTNLVIAVVKSVLHTEVSDREYADRIARRIADFITTDNAVYNLYGSDENAVEEFTRDYVREAKMSNLL